MADVIAISRRSRRRQHGLSGNGTAAASLLEMFRFQTGLKINHVPIAAEAALTDVMSGQVKFFFANGSSVVGLIRAAS